MLSPFTAPSEKHAGLLASARDLSALIRAEAPKAEAQGFVTDAVADALRQTRLFWMVLPAEVGGGGGDLLAALDVIEELCRADGATGWSFMANAMTTGFAGAYVGDNAADAMFGGATPAITAGMLAPGGRAVPVAGGLRGGGKYGFGSGCAQADWMGGGVILMKDGAPIMGANGRPVLRICYLPKDKVQFLGNWDVTGLRATGSQDYVISEQFFADDFTIDGALESPDAPRRGGDLYRVGLSAFVAVSHAAFALGMMKCALEEVAAIASNKKRLGYTTTVANNEIFKREFAHHESSYRSGRAYCHEVFGDAQETVLARATLSPEQNARMRIVSTWVTQLAMDVTRFGHVWAGASSIRDSALARCIKDMNVGSQHMIVDPASLAQFAPSVLEAWVPIWPGLPRTEV